MFTIDANLFKKELARNLIVYVLLDTTNQAHNETSSRITAYLHIIPENENPAKRVKMRLDLIQTARKLLDAMKAITDNTTDAEYLAQVALESYIERLLS